MRPVLIPVSPVLSHPPPVIPDTRQSYDEATFNNYNFNLDYSKKRPLAPESITLANALIFNKQFIGNWIIAGMTVAYTESNKANYDKFNNINEKIQGHGEWGNARRQLIAAIGPYCSYCGLRINSNLAIEHILPKSSFPDSAYAWSNFLLACPSCNSCKGDKPDINAAFITLPPPVPPAPPPVTRNRLTRRLRSGSKATSQQAQEQDKGG
ncbi:MAG: HNH endonuclease [Proteobacteria bacterium]|nr:HNH endonuclease [Pseudomonadota bacterium]